MSRDGAEVTSAGRSFHMRAPATGKARCPIVGSLTTGTQSSSDVEDRNLCRDGMSAIYVNCGKYCGAVYRVKLALSSCARQVHCDELW